MRQTPPRDTTPPWMKGQTTESLKRCRESVIGEARAEIDRELARREGKSPDVRR